MAIARMPPALAERLGEKGTEGLVTLLASTRAEWTDEVLATTVERFEHRLTTEMSLLRVDMSSLRVEMSREMATLRLDVTNGLSEVRAELSEVRVELLKWSFLFWVGQLAAVSGLLAFMLRR